jgi:predicted transcriptional regulator
MKFNKNVTKKIARYLKANPKASAKEVLKACGAENRTQVYALRHRLKKANPFIYDPSVSAPPKFVEPKSLGMVNVTQENEALRKQIKQLEDDLLIRNMELADTLDNLHKAESKTYDLKAVIKYLEERKA